MLIAAVLVGGDLGRPRIFIEGGDGLPEQHLIIDIGPGVSSVLLALIVAIPGILAAYYARSANGQIKQGNSELAAKLARMADAKAATEALAEHPNI